MSNEYLDLDTLGPPQSSSSPVKPTLIQQTETSNGAAKGGALEHVSGVMAEVGTVQLRQGCPTKTTTSGSPAAGGLQAPTSAAGPQLCGQLGADPQPLLDLSPVGEPSGPCHQPLTSSRPKIRLDSGYKIADAELKYENTSKLASNLATCLPDTTEDTTRKLSNYLSLSDTSKLFVTEFIGRPNSADSLMPPRNLTVSGVSELSENTSSDRDVCTSSSFQTKGGPQAFHSRVDISSSGSKLDVDQFDFRNRKVKTDVPRPIFVDERTSKRSEMLYPTQGSKVGMKFQDVQFKTELGTRETIGKGTARGWYKNGLQTPQHRSGNTWALPPANVSLMQSSQREKYPHVPKEKPVKTCNNKVVKSPPTSYQQRQFKYSAVGERGIRQSTKTKWQQQTSERLTLPPQQQQSEEERSTLSPFRVSVPKQPNELQLQSSRNHKNIVNSLHEHGTIHEFVTPRRNKNTKWKFCRNKDQQTGIPSPLKGLERNISSAVSNSMSSQMLSQQRYSPAVSSTAEPSQQLRDSRRSEMPVNRAVCQQPVIQRTALGATSRPGIVLTDEIPTRDGDSREKISRVTLSASLADSTQWLHNVPAKQNALVDAPTNVTQELAVCRTAEAGTQTVLSVSTSATTGRTVPTAPTVHSSQQTRQHYRDESTPSVEPTIPNSLPRQNQTRVSWSPRERHPISQRVPMLFHPHPPIWHQTYQTPVAIQTPPHYAPLYPRYSGMPRLLNDTWTGYSFPYAAIGPFLRFPSPRMYYAPPIEPIFVRPPVVHRVPPEEPTWLRPPAVHHAPPEEPTWVMPPVVHHAPPVELTWTRPPLAPNAPPNDTFWQPLARSFHYRSRPGHHPSRQATNARVAAWLRQMDVAGGSVRGDSPTALSSDSGIQVPVSSSSSSSHSSTEQPHSWESRAGVPTDCSQQ